MFTDVVEAVEGIGDGCYVVEEIGSGDFGGCFGGRNWGEFGRVDCG